MKYDYFSVYCFYPRDMMNKNMMSSGRREQHSNFLFEAMHRANIKFYTRKLRFYLYTAPLT